MDRPRAFTSADAAETEATSAMSSVARFIPVLAFATASWSGSIAAAIWRDSSSMAEVRIFCRSSKSLLAFSS